MSPRPRQASDEAILAAAFRAIARLGPAKLTLADVAAEAGLSAAALVQRFGSKRALLLATAADAAGGSDYIFPALDQIVSQAATIVPIPVLWFICAFWQAVEKGRLSLL